MHPAVMYRTGKLGQEPQLMQAGTTQVWKEVKAMISDKSQMEVVCYMSKL
jgi:hypothetical protein